MHSKVFVRVFFEKKKIILFFFLILTLLFVYLGTQMMIIHYQRMQLEVPDVEISGKVDDDGAFRFKMYNDLKTADLERVEELSSTTELYPVVVRNIVTIGEGRAFKKVRYWVLGVDEAFIQTKLQPYIKKGRAPSPGANEVLVGGYAAKYFKVDVGDLIQAPVSLRPTIEETDMSKYTVSGILDDSLSYFQGAVLMYKNEFEVQSKVKISGNLLLGYAKQSRHSEMLDHLSLWQSGLKPDSSIGMVSVNYDPVASSKLGLYMNIGLVSFVSLIITGLLLSYFMKGISGKIGLLKALGLSDSYIARTLFGGLLLIVMGGLLCSVLIVTLIKHYMNESMSKFLEFDVELYRLSLSVYGVMLILTFVLFLATGAIVFWKSKRISPRQAMMNQ